MPTTPSVAIENFLKVIYIFGINHHEDAKPGAIAKKLGITSAAVTDMAKKLAEKDLVVYEKYKTLHLTPKGEKMALSIVRKHRIWETFLHQTLGLSLHEIHREAELLEHQTSDFLEEKIYDYLGRPLRDPHGDPIPDINGIIVKEENHEILSQASKGGDYEIVRLISSDKEFFDFCHNNGIEVGKQLHINHQYTSNQMTEITLDEIKILLPTFIAHTIYVKKVVSE